MSRSRHTAVTPTHNQFTSITAPHCATKTQGTTFVTPFVTQPHYVAVDRSTRVSLPATHIMLTPTSTPAEIYAQISSLTELRRQSNLFEAALSEQQLRGSTAEDGDGGGGFKQHSTCFKLYQAVRSLKKRDNKKDKKERLYPTLAAAFDAHRRRTLGQDCEDDKSGHSRSAEESASRRTTTDPSHPPPSSVSAIAVPAAAEEAAPPSVHVASSSTSLHRAHDSSAASSTLHHSSDSAATRSIPRQGEDIAEMRRVLYHLLKSSSRVHAQLKGAEEEVCSLRTQLSDCRQLLTTWERHAARDPGDDQGLIAPASIVPAEAVSSGACSIGDGSPSSPPPPPPPPPTAQAESVMEWKEAAETTSHADFPPPASPSQSSCNDEAHDDAPDDNAAMRDNDGDDIGVDAPSGVDVRDVESESHTRYESSKRSRSSSEDGEVSPKRQPCHVPSRSVHQAADGAAVDATTGSDGRCVWVQSQWEMCKDDLTMIFSHFGRVDHVDVPKPRPGGLPFAFVHFEAEEDARWSIRQAVDGVFGCLKVKTYQQRRQARGPRRRMG